MDISSEAKQEVERLLAAGQKIQAVEYLQTTFNITTEQARQLADVVEAEWQARSLVTESASSTALDGELKLEVIDLLESDQKLEAIKLVKTELGTGLKEALAMVEEVQPEAGINHRPSNTPEAKGCIRSTFTLVSLIFGFVGFLLFCIAGAIYYFQSSGIENSQIVTGRVSDLVYSSSMGTAPVITYEWHGKQYTYQSNTFSTPPSYAINEKVELYVNNDDPTDVVVNTFVDRWLAITIVGGLGFVFSLFATVFFIAERKINVSHEAT
jgi:ribosomal protein L7/L12